MIIEGIVKKIMYKGLNKYAKLYDAPVVDIQIKITNNPERAVNYEICKNMIAVEQVSFLQIMDSKLDLLGYESMSSPVMKDSLSHVALIHNADVNKMSCFIHEHRQELWLAFYNEYKNVKTIRLSEHLAGVGMSF